MIRKSLMISASYYTKNELKCRGKIGLF
jgi:hypothetical protein